MICDRQPISQPLYDIGITYECEAFNVAFHTIGVAQNTSISTLPHLFPVTFFCFFRLCCFHVVLFRLDAIFGRCELCQIAYQPQALQPQLAAVSGYLEALNATERLL